MRGSACRLWPLSRKRLQRHENGSESAAHCDGCASADCHGSGRRSESGNSHPHCDHNTDCNRDTNCNGHSDANLNRSVCPANYARAHACSHCHAHLNRNCADDSAITFTFA